MSTIDHSASRPLVIGYGNPHRQDDRVGHVIAEALQQWASTMGIALDVVTAYQLDLDMVDQIGNASLVVFVDAHKPEFSNDLSCAPVTPDTDAGFTTHAFTPGSLLSLAARLGGPVPPTFIVSVPGYAFDMIDGLSERTAALVADAVAAAQRIVLNSQPGEARTKQVTQSLNYSPRKNA